MSMIPLAKAQKLAWRVRDALAPMCERIDIAGSVRRARPVCGDIDIVCLPHRLRSRGDIIARCLRNATLAKGGEQYVMINLPGGVQLDLWFAHRGGGDMFSPEPCNYGMLLLARTGSARHNVRLASRAKIMGLHFHPHKGIMRGTEIIAAAEEADIFRALDLPYIEPQDREAVKEEA